MKKFQITGTVQLTVERIVEAESAEDACEVAEGMNADEWLDYVVNEYIEDLDVVGPIKEKARRQ